MNKIFKIQIHFFQLIIMVLLLFLKKMLLNRLYKINLKTLIKFKIIIKILFKFKILQNFHNPNKILK